MTVKPLILLLTLTALTGCVTASPQVPQAPVQVITEPPKCPILNANLLVKAKGTPTRELQGDVTAEEKINFLQEWLNAALAYGANETNHVNLLIDNVNCEK